MQLEAVNPTLVIQAKRIISPAVTVVLQTDCKFL